MPLLIQNIFVVVFCFLFYTCTFCQFGKSGFKISEFGLIDKNAAKETISLYFNLKKISKTNSLCSHQGNMVYGGGWWNINERSNAQDMNQSTILKGSIPIHLHFLLML